MKTTENTIRYCLYARKSSESDEKQAMSIDGQLREMHAQAKREKAEVIEVITESHSAKETGQRPQFNYMVENIANGKYNAIITWAPDRISRNAGDLGRIVDLMDQGKLLFIKTHTQTFSNNPNEKFLLMILCSQAKLENDNRGINVRRGLKNKCSVGIRPGVAPIGYLNAIKGNRIASVELDSQRAPIIKEMFYKVANQGYSGRMVKRWLDKQGFKTRNNCGLTLGRIYATLNNPFYYGEFRYGTKWYKGTHEPLITKYIFDKVQIQLEVTPRQWNKQVFPFKKLCKCGGCGGSITAEVKYRRTTKGIINTHIYYHCNRIRDYDCKEPYITETELIKQLMIFSPEIKLNLTYMWQEFTDEIKRLNHLKGIIDQQKGKEDIALTPHKTTGKMHSNISDQEQLMLRQYLLHILQFGTPEERLKILSGISSRFELTQRQLKLMRV
jgi:DNA invertase Pin-like site-specific DNA recombinase